MEETWRSEICGHEADSEQALIAHEESHELIVTRDGALGQYLQPQLVRDAFGLLQDRDDVLAAAYIPADVVTGADAWADAMSPSTTEPTEEQVDAVQDWVAYHASEVLHEQLGLRLYEEDGYVIFACSDDSREAHPAGKARADA